MSARDRARLNELIAINELPIYYKETGKQLPLWLDYGVADRKKINGSYALAETALDQIPWLMTFCIPGGADQERLKRAQATIERFLQGVNAMRELPKQTPKHRPALLALWEQAQGEIIEIGKCIQLWGVSPEQVQEDK
jgi:hypothetical protein